MLGLFFVHMHYRKMCTPSQGFLYALAIPPQLHAGLFVIVGQCPDNDSNKMSHRLTWCSEEVKCLSDILANKHISHLLDITHNNSEVFF